MNGWTSSQRPRRPAFGLLLAMFLMPGLAWAQTENVVWVAHTNTAAASLVLSKNINTWAWDAGAVSTKAITSGDGYVEATVPPSAQYAMFGLSRGDTDASYTDIDYAMYMAGEEILVFEAGAYRGSFGTRAPGEKLRVAVEGGVVKYRKNGALIYTSTVPPTYPLLVDTSLSTAGSRHSDLRNRIRDSQNGLT